MSWNWILAAIIALSTCAPGCRSGAPVRWVDGVSRLPAKPARELQQVAYEQGARKPDASGAPQDAGSGESIDPEPAADDRLKLPETIATPSRFSAVVSKDMPSIAALTDSVRNHFPLIQQAIAARTIASGETLAASGAFDHKLEGYSNSQPLDFYENSWHNIGLKRDTYWGGQVFGGYRVGRGSFEPWYLERETNAGGEFKAGVVVPLARNRAIDQNRAELWRAQLERRRVEPEVRAVIIGAVRDATITYWQWVAAAANFRVAESVLQLGLDRKAYLERQVEEGEKAEIDLVDNRRIILSRSAKATDALRKLEQASVKLSLFLRDDLGRPKAPSIDSAKVAFPGAESADVWGEQADVAFAQSNRPELAELQVARRQLSVLLRQAANEMRPQVDAGILVGQDVGEPTSSTRDKSQFELEATIALSVPLERRKALGKARQLRGKIAQIQAKTQFAANKIAIEAQSAHAALVAAATRVNQTSEGLELAERMQAAERRLYELGQSTLFNLNLREQQTAEAAVERVAALLDYHVAKASYASALGLESVEELTGPDALREPN